MSYRFMLLSCVMVISCLLAASAGHAGCAGTDVFLPSVGFGPGVPPSVWYTTVWVSNLSGSSANVTFYLLERNQANLAPLTYNDVIPAGATRKYDNAVQLMFARQTFGALRITANRRIVVSSRIYSQIGGVIEDSTGQFFAGVPESFSIGAGESTQILGVYQTQPADDSAFRTNFGFVETTGTGTCQVRVTVRDHTGATLGSKTYTVRRWEQLQKTFRTEFATISTQNARLTVEVLSGSGEIVAFGSGVTNGAQDPYTLEMVFADELLAENNSGGTITGVSAGSGLTGGGSSGTVSLNVGEGQGIEVSANAVAIADRGVSKNKLSASGGAAGQVLGTDGNNLVWQAPGFPLPYFASINLASGAGFEIENDGDRGIAITGRSVDYAGVFGISTDSIGVYGAGSNFIGVLGYGKTGVVGEGNGENSYGARFINYEDGEPGLKTTGGSNSAPDIILGGGSSSDDGRIYSEPDYSGSDIGLHSMDRVWIDLDDDDNSTGSFFRVRSGTNATIFNVTEEGDMTASGTKAAAVTAGPYGRVKLYALESPENWFEDFGSATLRAGQATVSIDPVFAETVNLAAGYHVFLTPLGDCPLFVADKGTTSFLVRASGGRSCDIDFDYRIVARRAGYEHLRLEKVVEIEDEEY